ncbi:hypothetical protein C8J56DRAFT_888000 [Mycena floridula]|nr:hypothetical protein C8J56DRAFT_888000 [Mycena floridula]
MSSDVGRESLAPKPEEASDQSISTTVISDISVNNHIMSSSPGDDDGYSHPNDSSFITSTVDSPGGTDLCDRRANARDHIFQSNRMAARQLMDLPEPKIPTFNAMAQRLEAFTYPAIQAPDGTFVPVLPENLREYERQRRFTPPRDCFKTNPNAELREGCGDRKKHVIFRENILPNIFKEGKLEGEWAWGCPGMKDDHCGFWSNSKPQYNRPLPPPGMFNDTPLNPVKPPALTSDTSTSSSPLSKHTRSSKKEPDPVKKEIISIEEQEQHDFALAIQRSLTDSSGIRQGPVVSSSMLSQSTAPRHSQSSYSPSPIKLPRSIEDTFLIQNMLYSHQFPRVDDSIDSSASISLNDQFWAQFLAKNHGNVFDGPVVHYGQYIEASQIPGFPITIEGLKQEAKLILGVQLGGKILIPRCTSIDWVIDAASAVNIAPTIDAASTPPPCNVKKRKLLSSPEPTTSQDQIMPGVLHSEADTDFVNLLNLLGGDGTSVSGASAAQLCSAMVQCDACQGVTWRITFSKHKCPSASHSAPLTFRNNKGKEKDTFIDLSFD